MKTPLPNLILLLTANFALAQHDVVIYGGTASGVAAAVQVRRMGKTVIVIEPGRHVGGLTSGGLGWTDSGNKAVIGGISREFYQRIKKHYEADSSWTFGKRDDFKSFRKDEDAFWVFEPKVAEAILKTMLAEQNIEVVFGERLNRAAGVKMNGQSIESIVMESGKSFPGRMFIDATYEGDLMAGAKVSYTTGRESNDKYGETMNGVAIKWQKHNHRFTHKVSPYLKADDPASGLLPGIEAQPLPSDGSADKRLQAYCFRMCMSLDPANQVPFAKPDGYEEKQHELLLRNFEAGDLRLPLKPDIMPNGKTDTNNNCAVSTDYIGQNYAYAEASYAERDVIIKRHLTYQQGLMWTLQSHPRTPQKIRDAMAKWGMTKDEFQDTGGWPHQIYVREARRMVSDYVQTEHDCRRGRETPESVGMGSYNMDSHNCCRYVTAEGFVQNEGDVQESTGGPYRISYRSIVPAKGQCENLLVPVCVSSSHIAYGSIRMEPVFMILGQSAATAAVLAIEAKCKVQDLEYAKLQTRLLADKQVLTFTGLPVRKGGLDPKKMEGIVVDDEDALRVGFEATSHTISGFVGSGYRHDGIGQKGKQSAIFTPKLPEAGIYEVRYYYTDNPNRAKAVTVSITHANGSATDVIIDQTQKARDGFVVLGKFQFDAGMGENVKVTNTGTQGHVVIDAVQWVKQ